jgi:hypothetical protein
VTQRAERIATQLRLHYRSSGGDDWYEASTDNISRTGVLFRGERLLKVDTPVEMKFETLWLPPLEPAGVTDVIWRGSIVRAVLPVASDKRAALAAKISQSQFVPGRIALGV